MKERADIPEWEVCIDADGRVSFAHPKQARAWLKHKHAGEVIVAQFYPHRTKRSDRQNRGFHAMIGPWAKDHGHRIDDLKDDILGAVFGYLESVNLLTGEVKRVLAEPHTSRLTMAQFCRLIDETLELAAGNGVILQAPDEYRRQREALAKKAERAARQVA